MSLSRKVRDPIHGFIEWKPQELELIDTPVFQRLRGIRQLAMAYLVYPGALHSRFEHSLGVFHIASRIARVVGLDDEEVRLVRLAALLHDIGHGPFSHVSENALGFLSKQSGTDSAYRETIHEQIGRDIILYHPQIANCLDSRTRRDIVALLSKGRGRKIVKDIISGPIDADKMDYLLRDSRFCGVQYGVYDLDQLINSFVPIDSELEGASLGVDEDGIRCLEQFVLAKYYIHTQVYTHKIRLISDTMLTRAMIFGAKRDNIPELNHLFRYKRSNVFIGNYVKWDDVKLIQELTSPRFKDTIAHTLMLRLKERRLFKLIFEQRIDELEDKFLKQFLSDLRLDSPIIFKIEAEIASLLKLQPYEVILNLVSMAVVRGLEKSSEGEVMVKCDAPRGGPPRPFSEESSFFRSLESYKDLRLECYAAVEYPDSTERQRKQRLWNDIVWKAITHNLKVKDANKR